MKQNRKWSALKLKKQYIYSQFDEAPRVRYKSITTVHKYLDECDHPRWLKRLMWKHTSWKKQRKKQYKINC